MALIDEIQMERSLISVVTTETPSDAKEYWKTRTMEERLEALELTRQILNSYDPDQKHGRYGYLDSRRRGALRIEVLKRISGVNFEDCWLRRVIIEDDDRRIPIAAPPLRGRLSNFSDERWKSGFGRTREVRRVGAIPLSLLLVEKSPMPEISRLCANVLRRSRSAPFPRPVWRPKSSYSD
jgi:hypothetical protein